MLGTLASLRTSAGSVGDDLKARLGQLWLRATGWSMSGGVPEPRRFVLIAAPHTSNWDLAYMLAMGWIYGTRIRWFGKHTLFRPPMGWVLRRVGGIPIDRRSPHGVVEQMAQRFADEDELILAVPAEGTRGKRDYWKSGFYEIAKAAKVPIVLGFLDYGKKVGGLGPALVPSGDLKADMDLIRRFYADKTGKHPEDFTPPRLRAEERVHH